MNREEIRARLIAILTSTKFGSMHVEASEIHDDTSLLSDIGLDSLQILTLIVAIENSFCLRLGNGSVSLDIFDRFDRLLDLISEMQVPK